MELFHFDIETAANYKDFETFETNDERGLKINLIDWVGHLNMMM